MMEGGAHALGCAVIPAGVGQTDLQLRAIADIRPHGYAGTPSFLKILVDKAREEGTDISSMTKALVTARPSCHPTAPPCARRASSPARAMARPISGLWLTRARRKRG